MNYFFTLITLLQTLVMVPVAHAWTPPESFVLEKLVKDHAKVRQAEFEARIVDLKLAGSFKELLKLDFVKRTGVAIATNEAGDNLGQITFKFSELKPMGLAWIILGFDPNQNEIRAALDELSIPGSETPAKLSRYRVGNGQVVTWSWGDTTRVHFSKDQGCFAGIQSPAHGSEPAVDLLSQDFNLASGGMYFPKSLHLNRMGAELFTYEMKASRFNAVSPSAKVGGKSAIISAVNLKPVSPAVQEWFDLVR